METVMGNGDRWDDNITIDQLLDKIDINAANPRAIIELITIAKRYQWLRNRANQKTAYDIYGCGAYWFIGFFTDDSRYGFDAALDSCIDKEKNHNSAK